MREGRQEGPGLEAGAQLTDSRVARRCVGAWSRGCVVSGVWSGGCVVGGVQRLVGARPPLLRCRRDPEVDSHSRLVVGYRAQVIKHKRLFSGKFQSGTS